MRLWRWRHGVLCLARGKNLRKCLLLKEFGQSGYLSLYGNPCFTLVAMAVGDCTCCSHAFDAMVYALRPPRQPWGQLKASVDAELDWQA